MWYRLALDSGYSERSRETYRQTRAFGQTYIHFDPCTFCGSSMALARQYTSCANTVADEHGLPKSVMLKFRHAFENAAIDSSTVVLICLSQHGGGYCFLAGPLSWPRERKSLYACLCVQYDGRRSEIEGMRKLS